jgi:PST family polysaccharide transporter
VVEKGLRLVLVALVARALGTKVYGQYTYAVAVAMLCVQITDMGLGLFLAREIARADVPPPRLIGQVLTIKAALAVVYLLVMAGLTWWHFVDPNARHELVPRHHASALAFTIALAGLSNLAASAIEAIWQIFRGIQRLELEARSGSFFAAAQLILVFGALQVVHAADPHGAEKSILMVAIALAMTVASGIGLYQTIRLMLQVVTPEMNWSREMLNRFRREVLPLGVAIVASLIYFKIDVPMLRALRGDEETGVYNAAYKILENLSLVPSVLLAATFPALSQTVVSDPAAALLLHRNTLRILIGAGLAGGLVLVVLPDFIVKVLYGQEFAPAAKVMMALAPSVVLTFVNYLETHMLVALGLVKQQMAFAIALIAVNVTANWLLIPRYGGVGAALGTAVTEVVLLGFCAPLVHRTLRARLAGVSG